MNSQIKEIRELTENNEHTQARMVGASMLGDEALVVEYKAIEAAQMEAGYLDDETHVRRIKADKKLFKLAENKLTGNDYPEFYYSF